MTPDQVKQILLDTKTIAVVGMSTNPDRPSHSVPLYLRNHGYTVIPVNPNADEIEGMQTYPTLSAIPVPVDTVEIFLPSDQVPPIVDEAIKIGAKVIWMQEGVRNDAAAERAEAAGLQVVQDRCMRAAHRFFFAEPKPS